MDLKRVTITGVDSRTDLDDLKFVAKRNPLVEFAFLASPSRAGKDPRYPTMEQIGEWSNTLHGEGIHTAIHVCGRYSRKPDEFFNALPRITRFDRIQWNVVPSQIKDKAVDEMILHQKSHGTVIVQIRDESSKELLQRLRDGGVRVQPLFDSSGGRGIPFTEVQKPLGSAWYGPWNGYAGGITNKNVRDVLRNLNRALEWEQPVWIDMETGVRTDNWLDLDKVEDVLVRSYVFFGEDAFPHGYRREVKG